MRAAKSIPTTLLKLISVLLGTFVVVTALTVDAPLVYAQEGGIDLVVQDTAVQGEGEQDGIVLAEESTADDQVMGEQDRIVASEETAAADQVEPNLTNFDTSNVTCMSNMFGTCEKPETLTLGESFNTSKVTSMEAMFRGGKALKTLTWPTNIDTSSVTSMEQMFRACKTLTDPGLAHFDTSNVESFKQMFDGGCTSLKTLDLSNFSTTSARTCAYMFQQCSAPSQGSQGTRA